MKGVDDFRMKTRYISVRGYAVRADERSSDVPKSDGQDPRLVVVGVCLRQRHRDLLEDHRLSSLADLKSTRYNIPIQSQAEDHQV